MFTRTFRITLLDDVAISADAASEGGHTALDYLPGSVFLGAAIARSLANRKKFDPNRFLSGRIRFSNAYPEVERKPSVPVPLVFHTVKGKSWENEPLHNILTSAESSDELLSLQKEQLRNGFLTTDGAFFTLSLSSRLKAAIDRKTGRAKDEQLFDRQSIPAGTTFILCVQADSEEDLAFAGDLLTEQKLRLGKSRSAEYGRATVEQYSCSEPSSHPLSTNGKIHLYLLSDLALIRNDVPILNPQPEDFGLPSHYKRDLPQTMLRIRRYSPWNNYFKCRMAERQVISKGSVLTFSSSDKNRVNLEDLQQKLYAGIGLYREEGLGQIIVNPQWLLKTKKIRKPRTAVPPAEAPKPENSLLIHYLLDKHKERQTSAEVFETARKWAAEWFSIWKELKRNRKPTPGKSQWSNIRTIATRSLSKPENLPNDLESFCRETLRRKQWNSQIKNGKSLDVAIIQKIGDRPDYSKSLTLRLAAIEMVRRIQNQDKTNR